MLEINTRYSDFPHIYDYYIASKIDREPVECSKIKTCGTYYIKWHKPVTEEKKFFIHMKNVKEPKLHSYFPMGKLTGMIRESFCLLICSV